MVVWVGIRSGWMGMGITDECVCVFMLFFSPYFSLGVLSLSGRF